ncbi:hypothetical protein Ndes2526B_g07974 [Nannochloris sp. 'desiccata']
MARFSNLRVLSRSLALLLEDATIPQARAFHASSGMWQAAPAAAKAVPKVTTTFQIEDTTPTHSDLTPRQVVELLDRYIVGQAGAKKSRCGKTEIARRLAKLADAPFVKVEATKFTEVGFHGRDVDQIIRDLVDNAIIMVKHRMRREQQVAINKAVEERLVAALVGEHATTETRAAFRQLYRDGELEDREVEVEVPSSPQRMMPLGGAGGETNIQEMVIRVDRLFRGGKGGAGGEGKRKLKISEARPLVEEQEAERFINSEVVTREAVAATEADGIVFIDEIDKIVTSSEYRYGADASSEGVQRDLLPIIEGSVVSTKHGNINTDHILFICSGAFHSAKPSDMLAELQGRLPVRVELKGLTQEDFYKILTEPEANMITQQQALLATENVELHFTDAAIKEISKVAEEVNTSVDNIGARRLHTIIERIVEDISFEAPDKTRDVNGEVGTGGGKVTVVIDKEDVVEKIGDLLKKQDLSNRRLATVFATDSSCTLSNLQTISTSDLAASQRPISLRAFTPPTSPPADAWLHHHHSFSNSTTTTTTTATTSSSLLASKINATNEWQKQVLYRGRGIQLFRILVRFKIAQLSGVAALAIPMATVLRGGEVSTTQAVVAGALLVGSGIVSTALWYYSRRYIGEVALLTKTQKKSSTSPATATEKATTSTAEGPTAAVPLKVRFSVLDFWGNREDVNIDLFDLVPPLRGLVPPVAAAVASEPFLPVTASGDRQYILSLRYGTIVDKEVLKALLDGSLEEKIMGK